MGLIYDCMAAFFVEDGWSPEPVDGGPALCMSCRGENGQWACIAQAVEDERLFLFYSASPVDVPPDKRTAVAEFITRANYGMLTGAFELSFDDGDLRFRTSLRLPDLPPAVLLADGLLARLIREVVYVNVQTMDRYLPGLHGVVHNGVDAAQAVAYLEGLP